MSGDDEAITNPGGWCAPEGMPRYRVGPSDELVKAQAANLRVERGGIRYGDTGPGTTVGKPTVPGTTWQESMGIEPEYRHGDDDPIVNVLPIQFQGQSTGKLLELHESGKVTWRNA